MSIQSAVIAVAGMSCPACVRRIEHSTSKLDGLIKISVSLAEKNACLQYDSDKIDLEKITKQINKLGYATLQEQVAIPAPSKATYSEEPAETTLLVQGMTCAACVLRIEKALSRTNGVIFCNVNLASEIATVKYLSSLLSIKDLENIINEVGYNAQEYYKNIDNKETIKEIAVKDLHKSLIFSAMFSIPLLALAMLPMIFLPLHHWLMNNLGEQLINIFMLLLALPVQFIARKRFYVSGWNAVTKGSPDMNTLVMLGALAAFLYSLVVTLFPSIFDTYDRQVYYESASVVITLVLLGKWLEAKAKGKSRQAIQKLLDLQPKTAQVLRNDQVIEVNTESLNCGDVVIVKAGERIPADGEIIDGQSYVDESMLTGESTPKRKYAGKHVTCGTINQDGAFSFRVSSHGEQTTLARMVRMVEEAQGSKPPVQNIAGTVVTVFVPIILLIAMLTSLAWLLLGGETAVSKSLTHGIAVLVIACPCAMGLATPVSIMVASGRGAQLGLLFRNASALELLGKSKTISLDKTGTLTTGKPQVTHIFSTGLAEKDLLLIAASAELHSPHPIAKAFAKESPTPLSVKDFISIAGYGIRAVVDGDLVEIGSAQFMSQIGVVLSLAEEHKLLSGQAVTPVFMAINGKMAGLFGVSDSLRSSSHDAISALKDMGIKVNILSGDTHATTQAVAAELGVESFLSGILPQEKAAYVANIRQSGWTSFVGDGINDALALTAADTGIAMGTGTDIAIEAADLVILSGDLRALVNATALSRATMKNIYINLFWAFAYNILLIPVAAGALSFLNISLSPMLAAGAMCFSSLFVVYNSLRLQKFEPPFKYSG